MSLHFNDIAKHSNARVRNKIGIWKQTFLILRKPSSKGPLRIDKYPDEKASMLADSTRSTVELKGVHQVTRIPKDKERFGVVLSFEGGKTFQMALESEVEANSWTSVIQELCTSGPSGMDLVSGSNMQDVFNVCLLVNPALDFHGECLLKVTDDSIHLLRVEDPSHELAVWPLPALRRYSRDPSKITFESGRKCRTGEGLFVFNTVHGEAIYQKLWAASNAMREAYRMAGSQGELTRTPSTPSTTFHNGLLQQPRRSSERGVSMSPRPLPPVPPVSGGSFSRGF